MVSLTTHGITTHGITNNTWYHLFVTIAYNYYRDVKLAQW